MAQISKEENFDSGQTIFHEGKRAEWLYILAKGSVDLFFIVEVPSRPELNKELLFGTISPGENLWYFSSDRAICLHLLSPRLKKQSSSHD